MIFHVLFVLILRMMPTKVLFSKFSKSKEKNEEDLMGKELTYLIDCLRLNIFHMKHVKNPFRNRPIILSKYPY